MKKAIITIAIIASVIAVQTAHGQSIGPSTLNAAGGGSTISGNSFDWSVGEMVLVSTFTSTSVIITQGVLQPVDGALSVAENNALIQNLQVYPNPANDVVNMQYTSSSEGTLRYRLMDMLGKTILDQSSAIKAGDNLAHINIASLAVATYMLEVSCEVKGISQQIKSYKIQKLQ